MSDGADLDIRWPIGLLFCALGVVLAAYGALAPHRTTFRPAWSGAEYALNLNLWWGLVMLAFGLVMMAGAAAAGKGTRRGR